MRGQVSAAAGDGGLAASPVGMRGLLGHGQRDQSRTHLKFLLGHKVLHTPNDLDGSPVVLSEPAGENKEKDVSGQGLGAFPGVPCCMGWAHLRARRMLNPMEWRSLRPCPVSGGEERGHFLSRVVPGGPFPC